jgi:hypothetical protein
VPQSIARRDRARKRSELLAATAQELDKIVATTTRARNPSSGRDKIGLRMGRVLNRHKVGKDFDLTIRDDGFSYSRNEPRIAEEAAPDGIYVIRTFVNPEAFTAENAVRAHKDLSTVERTFRSIKTVDLKVRQIFHWLDDRNRGHVFLCMLAYYIEWHMRERLAPLLFDDHERGRRKRREPRSWNPLLVPRPLGLRTRVRRPKMDCPSTASARCSRTS